VIERDMLALGHVGIVIEREIFVVSAFCSVLQSHESSFRTNLLYLMLVVVVLQPCTNLSLFTYRTLAIIKLWCCHAQVHIHVVCMYDSRASWDPSGVAIVAFHRCITQCLT